MKEYLTKMKDGSYKLIPSKMSDDDIEIPEGAEVATLNGKTLYFWKPSENQTFVDGEGWIVCVNIVCTLDEYKENDNNKTVWQRETINDQVGYRQAEELPFVDDELSLNDQYAEIEQVRQESQAWANRPVGRCRTVPIDEAGLPDFLFEDTINHLSHNHYFIDVSDIDEVDFYEIALRYNVTDPCIQHILKKCLAVGNRGHKDFHTDLKDIYDTAARALRIHVG